MGTSYGSSVFAEFPPYSSDGVCREFAGIQLESGSGKMNFFDTEPDGVLAVYYRDA